MARWGEYETLRELSTAGMGTIWSARRVASADAEERYIIKAIEGLSVLADEARAEREIAVFLEGARAQQQIVEHGAVGVARVHECGRKDDAAYLVSDLYSRSLATLIARGVLMTRDDLSHLAASVVDGLREIQRVAGRAHGNLKAGNVLIGGRDGPFIGGDPIVLTDLRAPSLLTDSSYASDVRGLGAILYEAITRRPLREREQPDLTPAGVWDRLGSTAATWSEICRRLLRETPGAGPPSLEEIRAMLPRRSAGQRTGRTVFAVGIGALVLGVAVGSWWRSGSDAQALRPKTIADSPADERNARLLSLTQLGEEWPGIVNDWGYWFFAREAIAAKLERLPKGAAERVPATLLSALRPGDLRSPAEIVGVPASDREQQLRRNPSTWSEEPTVGLQGSLGRIRDASDARFAIAALRTEIRAFAPSSKLEDWAAEYQRRGWIGAARRMRSAADQIAAIVDPGTRDGAGISPDGLAAGLSVVACARSLDEVLRELADREAQLSASGDPVLAGFPAMVSSHTAQSFRGETDAERFARLEADVREALELATGLLARSSNPDWDRASFLQSSVYQSLAGKPASDHGLALASAWLREAGSGDYAPLSRAWLDDWRTRSRAEAATLRLTLGAAVSDERRARRFKDDPASIRAGLDDAEARITALAGVFVSARSEPGLRKSVEEIDDRLSRLAVAIPRESEFESIEALLAHARTVTFGSAAIEARWKAAVTDASRSVASGDVASVERRLLHEWEPRLRAVEEAFVVDVPPIPSISREALDRVLATRRERDLSKVADRVAIEAEALPVEIEEVAKDYREWAEEVVRAAEGAGRASFMLSRGYGLDEPDAGGVTMRALLAPSLQQPLAVTLTPVVRPITARVAELESLSNAQDVEELLSVAERSSNSDLSLAVGAIERLSRLGVWSSASGEAIRRLERVARVAKGFPLRLDGTDMPSERAAIVVARVETACARIWESAAVGASRIEAEAERASSLDAVFSLAEVMGVAGRVSLSGRAAFNWELWTLRQRLRSIPAGTPSAESEMVGRASAPFITTAVPLADDPGVRRLLRRLERGMAADAPAEFSPDDAGPRAWETPLRAKWSVRESAETLTYLWAGPTGTHAIDFRLVSAPGLSPFYMATRELTLGLFLDALAESGRAGDLAERSPAGGAVLEMPAVERREVADSRRGPRVWTAELRSDARIPIRPTLGGGPDSMWGWYTTNETMIGFRGPSPRQSYLPNFATLPNEQLPTVDKPVQYISPEAAVLVARLLGCRLPTSAEWRAALEGAGGLGNAASGANLRDESWRIAFDQIELMRRTHRGRYTLEPEMPNGGIFWPLGSRENTNDDPPEWDRSPASAVDDGVLFFRDAARGPTPDSAVQELIGNVAEMLWEDPRSLERLPYAPTAAELFEAIPRDYAPLRVVGGSALSPPGWGDGVPYRPDEPYSPESPARARRGYSDLGVRLAFPAVGLADDVSPRERAVRALQQAQYLREAP
jgi:hypothetical protein